MKFSERRGVRQCTQRISVDNPACPLCRRFRRDEALMMLSRRQYRQRLVLVRPVMPPTVALQEALGDDSARVGGHLPLLALSVFVSIFHC